MKSFSTVIAEHFPNLKDMNVIVICQHRSWETFFECLPLIQPASFQQIPHRVKGSLKFHRVFETGQFDEVSFR